MRRPTVAMLSLLFLLGQAAVAWAQQIPPQVAILRQINHVNDDGSYTYGYEAADGSFKIETRDATGTVRGMFGFVDERGRHRRVSYTAGNTTGFQTTGGPASDLPTTPLPPRIAIEHRVPRPVNPLPTAPTDHRDSVAKLIRQLGILGAKQAGSHRFLYPLEGSSTTTTQSSKHEEDQFTTRRPTVVQRIVRTRPRSELRKVEGNSSNSRKAGEKLTVGLTTEKYEEVEEKYKSTPPPQEATQKRPIVNSKVAENPRRPNFVILPSRLLRWRTEEHDGKAGLGEVVAQPEPLIRQRLAGVPGEKDSLHYQLRQLPREQLAAPQTPLQIFAQRSELPTNARVQQYIPQKNILNFLSSTPSPGILPSRQLPVPLPLHPDGMPRVYHRPYDPSETPNGGARVAINDGNYAQNVQFVPHYLPHNQLLYPQRVSPNLDPNRYGLYYTKPNYFHYPPQNYSFNNQRGLIELLLALLQNQKTYSPSPQEYSRQLPDDPRIVLPQSHNVQENSAFHSPAIFIPYTAPNEQFQIPVNNMVPTQGNYELARILDKSLSPAVIRQQINAQNRIQVPRIYNNGNNLPYTRKRGNIYPINMFFDPQHLNFRDGVVLQPTPLQIQPLYVETSRSHASPNPLAYPLPPVRPGGDVRVTTVSPRSTVQTPSSGVNQGLPFGFTKKIHSVEIIAPETYSMHKKQKVTEK